MGIHLGINGAIPFPGDCGGGAAHAAALPQAAEFNTRQPAKLLSLRKVSKCPLELERIRSLKSVLLCFLYLMLKITVITF